MAVPTSPPAAQQEKPKTPQKLTSDRNRTKRQVHFWLRWAHVYISMFGLLIMLFFGITGVTLNHPSWVFGDEASLTTISGDLPAEAITDDGPVFLVVSEFIRSKHAVSGEITNFGESNGEGTISYKAPGYGADLFFDSQTGSYELTVSQQGFVGVMNDLHKGRDSSTTWKWIIDISGVLLVAIALTGFGIQLFLRKRRRSALTWSVVGSLVAIAFIWWAMP